MSSKIYPVIHLLSNSTNHATFIKTQPPVHCWHVCAHTQYLKTHKALHMLSSSLKPLNSASSKHLGQLSNEDCSQFSSWHHNVHLILCAIQLPALRKKIPDFKNFFFNICLAIVMTSYLCPGLFDVSSFFIYMKSNSKNTN